MVGIWRYDSGGGESMPLPGTCHGCPSIASVGPSAARTYGGGRQRTYPLVPLVPEAGNSNVEADAERERTDEDGRYEHTCGKESVERGGEMTFNFTGNSSRVSRDHSLLRRTIVL